MKILGYELADLFVAPGEIMTYGVADAREDMDLKVMKSAVEKKLGFAREWLVIQLGKSVIDMYSVKDGDKMMYIYEESFEATAKGVIGFLLLNLGMIRAIIFRRIF